MLMEMTWVFTVSEIRWNGKLTHEFKRITTPSKLKLRLAHFNFNYRYMYICVCIP